MNLSKTLAISTLLVLYFLPAVMAGNHITFFISKSFKVGLCTADGAISVPPKYVFISCERTGRRWVGTTASCDEYEGVTGQLVNDIGEPITPAMFSDYVDFWGEPDVRWGRHEEVYVKGNDKGKHLNYVVFSDGTIHCLGGIEPLKTDLRFVASECPDGSVTIFDTQNRKTIDKIVYDNINVVSDSSAIICKNGKYGVISPAGRILLDIAFDKVDVFNDTSVVYAFDGEKAGLYDLDGGWLLGPEKDLELDFRFLYTTHGRIHYGKMLVVSSKGKYGIFNLEKKTMVVPAEYDKISHLTSSVAIMQRDDKWHIISFQTGKPLDFDINGCEKVDEIEGIPNCNCTLWRFSNGAALLKDYRIDYYLCFNDKLVRLDGVDFAAFAYLDKMTCVVFLRNSENKAAGACSLDGNRYLVPMQKNIRLSKWRNRILVSKEGKPGNILLSIVDQDGKTLLDFAQKTTFIDWHVDAGGFSKIISAGKAGLVDGDCKFVLPCHYEDVGHFGEGVVPAKQGGKWGFVTMDEKWVIPACFEEARSFKGGYAPVRLGGKWGFVDKSGKAATPFAYENVKDVREGHFRAQANGKWGIFALDGTCTLPAEYDNILSEDEYGYSEP